MWRNSLLRATTKTLLSLTYRPVRRPLRLPRLHPLPPCRCCLGLRADTTLGATDDGLVQDFTVCLHTLGNNLNIQPSREPANLYGLHGPLLNETNMYACA